jgi:hypothetical protein
MPGESVRAYLSFLSPELHVGKIAVGMPFLVREGHKTVGYGSVRRIIGLEKEGEGREGEKGKG